MDTIRWIGATRNQYENVLLGMTSVAGTLVCVTGIAFQIRILSESRTIVNVLTLLGLGVCLAGAYRLGAAAFMRGGFDEKGIVITFMRSKKTYLYCEVSHFEKMGNGAVNIILNDGHIIRIVYLSNDAESRLLRKLKSRALQ